MIGLLTIPTYGTRLEGRGRGWLERRGHTPALPEPLRAPRPAPSKWPAVQLRGPQQAVVVADLARIAALRGFRLIRAVTASDHVHVLLGCEDDRDVPRLVQLVKGALSRALSVAGGDAPAESVGGERLPHHKWWARQYSFRVLRQDELAPVVAALDRHADVPGSTLS